MKIRTAAFEYLREASGFDCSVDESYRLRLPVSDLVSGIGIRWSGWSADFVDAEDRLAAQDPTARGDGPSALLIREDLLREYLAREKLTICWAVLGEKRVLGRGFGTGPHHPALRMSGAFVLGENGPVGFVKRLLDDPAASASSTNVINVVRRGN
ncbi:MAG: hypothetical protein JST54_35515 [Deltaproteobacteria bacterium]|nr:hypothetical protein [Deltaproteobacteria bacterium]